MHKINIAPLTVEHAEELVQDMIDLYQKQVIDSVAFSFTLVPEGIPAMDKAAECVRRFKVFQKLLKAGGVPTGILIQATWGHGWTPDTPTDFQRIRKLDGSEQYTMCPEGEEFRAYVRNAIQTTAAAEPDFLMLDDDTRFITGRNACFCPLHTALFNQKTGRNLTSDELREAVRKSKEDAVVMDGILQESMIKYATLIREAIDSVNPDIACSFCLCSQDVRHAPAVAKILSGKKGEAVIRINNARYLSDSLRTIPAWLAFTATQVAAFDDDITLICELDTFPQNRYSTSAATLRMHVIMSALEGCKGGKFWITRMSSFEPNSGKAYRKVLSENAGLLEAIYKMKPTWQGACIPMPAKPVFNYPNIPSLMGWNETFGRMGLPMYFSKKPGKTVALAFPQVDMYSDDELRELFQKHNVLLDGSAALAISKRGLDSLIGCSAQNWTLPHVSYEQVEGDEIMPASSTDIVHLTPGDNVTALSWLYHQAYRYSDERQKLAPGAVLYTKPDGGKVITMANYVGQWDGLRSFNIFNEARKRQLVKILQTLDPMPIWYPEDAEVLLKAAVLEDGTRIAVLMNIGLDVLDDIPLVGPWTSAIPQRLQGDGKWAPLVGKAISLVPAEVAILKY